MGAPPTKKTDKRGSVRAPQKFHYHKHFKDSRAVQTRRNSVNDDEVHEDNAHLQDFLVVHHTASVDPLDCVDPTLARPPVGILQKHTLARPCTSILHDRECARRRPCATTEGKPMRRVQFKQVTVRDYAMVLGDHPCCSWGPPVMLGWDYVEYDPLDLNEYEFHHALRRPLRKLMLNALRRTEMLLAHNDHTDAELKSAVKEKDRANLHRSLTRSLLPCWRVEDAVESAARKLRRKVQKRPSKKYWVPQDELDYSVRTGKRHGSHTPILKTLSA